MKPHFATGQVIVYRRVRDGRVLLAVPLQVVEDTPELVILYQAPDTAFTSARTADGSKVHDFSDWP